MARFDPDAGFFDAPFPIAGRSRSGGGLRVADFPNPTENAALDELLSLLEEDGGFALNGGVFVPFEGEIDAARLPADPAASLEPEATVFLVDIDPDSPARGERIPIETSFKKTPETYSPANLLIALPYAGFVLAPRTHYALLVRRALGDANGRALFAPNGLVDALDGFLPAGELRVAFESLRVWLGDNGIDKSQLAAATVFETGDPLAPVIAARTEVTPPVNAARLVASTGGYCRIAIATSSASGGELEALVTVPHAAMPPAGFPLVIYLGSDESEIDAVAGIYAHRGLAALTAMRPAAGDNPGAVRDALHQSIGDVTSLVGLAANMTLDASLCPDAQSATGSFHYDRLFIHGHSGGSVVASVSIALEPRLEAAVLSGAAGGWIQRLVTGVPLPAAIFGAEDEPDRFDPVMTLFQTAFEPVEPMSWAPRVLRDPLTAAKQMLLVQGVPDSRHPARAINAFAMSAGLDLVQPEIEPSARADYELAGRGVFPAPITGNITGMGARLLTGATVQHAAAGDGHQVALELDEAKYRYSCFLASLVAGGTGTVPAPASDAFAPCP